MNRTKIVDVAQIALLSAIEIMLSRFFSISTPIAKIGFSFLPVAMIAMLHGPLWAAVAAASADLIGAMLFPTGAYFPGFTLTAGLTGLIYGLLLYRHPKSWGRIIGAVLLITLVLNLGLDMLWLHLLTGKGIWALLPARVLKSAVMIPIQIIGVRFAWERLCPRTREFAES